MPINPNIPLQAANIPQIRYQPESQFESFAKIQPTLNAMRQMRQEQMQTQQSMAEQQALQEIRQRGYDPEEIGTLLQMHGKTQAQMELGVKMVNAARAARADQRPSVVGPGSALISHEGKELYRAPPVERAEPPGTEILQLLRELNALPADSPDRAVLKARIDRLNAPPSGVTIQMPVPVYDPKTGQTTYVTREEALGKTPASAAPKPVDTTQSEEQAATATARLLRRSREISAALQRSPAAEAPSAMEASIQNIPGLSAATNLVRSSDRQIVASAQDDILDALLYLATGAAYNKEQLQQQKNAYLASWSDSAATRAVKRQRLTDMVRDAKIRAGNAWTPELDSQLNLLLESPTMRRQSTGGAAQPAPRRTAPQSSAIPAGVDPEDWKYMTDEEKALWK
jgi:hypothetical protein